MNSTETFEFNFQNFDSSLKDHVLHLISQLYSFSDMPRKRVEDILNLTTQFFNMTAISKLQRFNKPFENFDSEYHTFKELVKTGNFIKPKKYVLGEKDKVKRVHGVLKLCRVPITAQFIPIRHVLTRLFRNPEIFQKTISYISCLENDSAPLCTNIIQASFWKELKTIYSSKIVLPLIMFFDDFENNNPLGSNSRIGKCGAIYISIPCLPPEFQSKLENIFLFVLFNTADKKQLNNAIIFNAVIKELQFLESDGILVSFNNVEQRIYFKLVLIIGENLGLHSIVGFVEGVTAPYPCRFCLINKSLIKTVFHERSCILRNVDNYEEQINLNNCSLTGIKELCCFHKLKVFMLQKMYLLTLCMNY
ncbi:uncharacterized protein [Prorops nasuta]|uniref:uncharacterized protein n=1 Tax=Prorops nasuta TaxID=863751 RepID=UPI0034CE2A05